MRPTFCKKCNQKTEHLMETYEKGEYQIQYEKCIKCGSQIPYKKLLMPQWFKDMKRKGL